MVDSIVDQAGLYSLTEVIPPTRVDQSGLYGLARILPPTRVDQAGAYALTAIEPAMKVEQAGAYALASATPCTTRWAQAWSIRRADGIQYRFTSLDRDLVWRNETYRACGSLNPSASESVSEVGAAGSIDLSGAIGEGGISELALFAGLLDGAVAEAWLVPWDGDEMPRLLLRGTFGPVDHGDTGFKVELLGDGGKLTQTPLIQQLQPGCRHQLGDGGCKIDLAPVTVAGIVTGGTGQRAFVDAGRGEAPGTFTRGRVTFTSGVNAGISAEIKEHAAGGKITLWPRLAFPISPGATYEMTPGCTNIRSSSGATKGCDDWANYVNYGGADHVPGRDKRNTAADAR